MIKIAVKGIEKVVAFLRTVELGAKTRATRAAAEYLIGDESHGLKHEPGYVYVNRQAGFGSHGGFYDSGGFVPPGYVSSKQHRYVMASIADGTIRPGQDNRTHQLQGAWRIAGEAPRYIIENDTSYAQYVMGDTQQTQMHNLIGWRRASKNIADNIAGAIRHATAAVNAYLRENTRK